MTISSALSAALTGLSASSRAASVVSENIANARTEGFGARSLSLASVTYGAGRGVQVTGETRASDPVLLGERRAAGASRGEAETRTAYLQKIENLIGTPDAPGSLSARLDAFAASLVSAQGRPDSQSRLAAVLNNAKDLAATMNGISNGIQSLRREADSAIGTAVERLNRTLASIHDLNGTIRTAVSRGDNAHGLIDRQQTLVDSLSDLMPIRETRSETGLVNLFTADGLSLLDGRPATFGFTETPAITPLMSLADGDLSGLTVNGRPVSTTGAYATLGGGKLAALFAVRDEIAPGAQSRLDGVALDLAVRLGDPALDATRAPTDPGVFTDDGALVTAGFETGLAGRLRVNAAVDPDQGGATWRLRDGVGAVTEGLPGDPGLLRGLLSAIEIERPTLSSVYSGTSRNLPELAADFLSLTAMDRQFADARQAETSATFNALKEMELSRGVDMDAQMRRLLEIENAYAANARVLSTLDDMIDRLMGI